VVISIYFDSELFYILSMRKILIIIFSILITSCGPTKEDEIKRTYYSSGNLKSEMYVYADDNISWIKNYYDMSNTKEQEMVYLGYMDIPSGNNHNVMSYEYHDMRFDYFENGQVKEYREYYTNSGKTKNYIRYDRSGDARSMISYDVDHDDLWGYDKDVGYYKDKPSYGFNTKDAGYRPCKRDEENSIHSWDKINKGYGGTTWRCRGVDNGKFVDNCNCQNFLKIDSRWPGL